MSGRADDIILKTVSPEDFGGGNNLLQSPYWARLKARFGWTPHCFQLTVEEKTYPLMVLCRPLFRGFTIGYIPYGFDKEVELASWEFLPVLAKTLKSHLPASCLFLRFDLPWITEASLSPDPPALDGLYKAAVDIQPSSTVLLDLTDSVEDILGRMKPKTRYNIRLSQRKGVKIEEGTAEDLASWYKLYQETSARDRIAIHSYPYYQAVFQEALPQPSRPGGVIPSQNAESPEIRLLVAKTDGKIHAGIIVGFYRGQATYLYGASSNQNRNLMPAYGLQWQAIALAKEKGCKTYDFFGIPPVDDPDHPMYGLFRFKTGFGGRIVHRPGCWDFPYKRFVYALFRFLEKSRSYYFKRLKKRELRKKRK